MGEPSRRSVLSVIGATTIIGSLSGCLTEENPRPDYRIVVHNQSDSRANIDVILTNNDSTDAVAHTYNLDANVTDESQTGKGDYETATVVRNGKNAQKHNLTAPTCEDQEIVHIVVVIREDEIEISHSCTG